MARDLFAESGGPPRDLFAEVGISKAVLARKRDFQKDEGFFDRAESLITRGAAGVGSGLQRFAATAADAVGLDGLAAEYRDEARIGEEIARTPVAGETTWEDVKRRPSIGSVAKFAAEQGVQSITDIVMAGTGVGLPFYMGAQAGRIGQQRAENDGRRDATLGDVVKAAPAAAASAFLERVGARGIVSPGGGSLVAGAVRAAGKEAATEAGQGVIENAGGTVGTQRGFKLSEAADEALAGAVAGAGYGGPGYGAIEGSRRLGRGIIEKANVDSDPTPEDEASALNAVLDIGRAKTLMAGASASIEANRLLAENGAPATGSRVEVTIGDRALRGTVEDGFVTEDAQFGKNAGIRIKLDDGTTFDEYFSTLREQGGAIRELEADGKDPTPLDQVPAAQAQAPENEGRAKPKTQIKNRDHAIRFVMNQLEGGAERVVDSGGVTRYGVSKNANPDVDVENLTEAQAAEIYRRRYWNKLLLKSDTDPAFALVAFDAAINHGVGGAKKMIAEADGNAGKLLQLRREEYARLIAEDPAKYGRYERGWENRLKKIEAAIGGVAEASTVEVGKTEPAPVAPETESDDGFDFLRDSLLPESAPTSLAEPAPIAEEPRPSLEQQMAEVEQQSSERAATNPKPRLQAPDTPEFKNWFRDSAARDEAGQPVVVYHGTKGGFEAFDLKKRGSNTRETDARQGFFFSSNPEVAKEYAAEAGGSEVLPAFVSLQNPLIVDDGGADYNPERFTTYVHQAQDEGRDGLIIRNTRDGMKFGDEPSDTYVAFSPEQIKTTDNRGSFDPSDERFRYSIVEPEITPAVETAPIIDGTIEGTLPDTESAASPVADVSAVPSAEAESGRSGEVPAPVVQPEETVAAEAARFSIAEDAEPIASLSGEELQVQLRSSDDMPALREAAKKWYTKYLIGRRVRTSDGHEVSFNNRGLRKSTSKGEDLLKSVPAIRAVLEKGQLVETRPSTDIGTKAMHVYAGKVDVGGKRLNIGVFVRETSDGRFQYDLTKVDPERGVGAGLNPEGMTTEPSFAPALESTPDTEPASVSETSAPGRDLNAAPAGSESDIGEEGEPDNEGEPKLRRTAPDERIADLTYARANVRAELTKRLRQLGLSDKVALEIVDKIVDPQTGQPDERIAGSYHRSLITVAMDAAQDNSFTLDHESIHALKALGLIKASEWRTLVHAARADAELMASVEKRYSKLTEDERLEEAVADLFARWSRGDYQARGFERSAFQRIKDFLVALGEALRLNFKTAEDVLRSIESGEIGGREVQGAADAPQFSISDRSSDSFDGRTDVGGGGTGGRDGSGASAAPAFNDPSTEKRWQEAAKGVGDGPGLVEQAKGWWEDIAAGFSRHWRDLPNEARFSDVAQQLRKLEAAPQASTERTVRMLRDVVGEMSRAELDLFTRKVVLDDLTWEADSERRLPFGFTAETLAVEKAKIDKLVDADPKLTAAVRRRKLINREVANEMVAAGVLTREQIRNPAYFRHMVLDYAKAEMKMARGAGSKVKSPYWAKRMGSSLDINANLLEAEFEWLQKAQVDIATAKTIDWLKKSDHNIKEALIAKAKAANDEALLSALRRNADAAAAEAELTDTAKEGLRDVLAAMKADAWGTVPDHLRDAAAKLSNNGPDEGAMPLLAWILDNNKPGAVGAAKVLKAIGQRKSLMRAILGGRYIDPGNTPELLKRVGPDSFEAWQPTPGRHLFTAKTVPEHVIEGFVEKLSAPSVAGINRDEMFRALSAVREQLVVGGERYTMVLPKEIADTLTEFGDRRVEGNVAAAVAAVQGAWKRWVLINPRRFFKYNLNNMTGDLDAVFAGNLGVFAKVSQATSEMYAVMRKSEKPSARFEEAAERGVFDSGLSVQEIPDIARLSAFRRLSADHGSLRADKLTVAALSKGWAALQGFTQFRESIFRYAAYLDYVEKIEAGRPTGYGASVPKMVDAVKDPKDRAALLARDLIGDYGAISVAGGWLRRHLIPFWSWTEINTKRYWRLTSNAWSQGAGKGLATGGGLTISAGARISAALYLRMAAFYGLVWFWNNIVMGGDEEDELGEAQKKQMHLILGRNEEGEIVTLRMQGAFSDALSLLGMGDASAGFKRYLDGQGSLGDVLVATAKAPVNRTVTGLNPMIGVPAEQALGKELWPDIFNPRDIKDRWRHVFSTFSVEHEYDALMGKPSRGYGRSWEESVVYRRDPGEMAYDEAKGVAYDWLERVKGQSSTGSQVSPRSSALRDYRLAIKFGDEKAAEKALEAYYSFEGNDDGLEASIKRQHPLGPIAKKDRDDFLDSLTPEQLETFSLAEQWYEETYLDE